MGRLDQLGPSAAPFRIVTAHIQRQRLADLSEGALVD
jgi:hypothetical protein